MDDFDLITQEQRPDQVQEVWPDRVQILEFQADDRVSVKCAAFAATAESTGVLGSNKGRGYQCQVTRATIMKTPVKTCLWYGKEHAFWARWESWLRAQQLPSQQVLLQSLEQCPDRCHTWLQSPWDAEELKEALLQQAARAAKESKKIQSLQEKDDFLSWIVGAEKAHLGPVYKAIKGPEQTTLRPYRDKSLLCRAYLRMEFWSHIWDGTLIRPPVEITANRTRLKAEARKQASALPPLQWEDVKAACHKTGNKKGGVDCWSYRSRIRGTRC